MVKPISEKLNNPSPDLTLRTRYSRRSLRSRLGLILAVCMCCFFLTGCSVLMQLLRAPTDSRIATAGVAEMETYPDRATEPVTQALSETTNEAQNTATKAEKSIPFKEMAEAIFDYAMVPEYAGEASVTVHKNVPFFTDAERQAWGPGTEVYPDLDALDRCRPVYACVGPESMPGAGMVRGAIGMVKPSGWQTVKYPELIEDLYLYNRCHLIGWQLGGENANESNLITGTRYLNMSGMLPYENLVSDYVKRTGNHVLYRVTPFFFRDELVARGVLIEAEGVEDATMHFCVWCYNVQPGVEIDYATGNSWTLAKPMEPEAEIVHLVLNKNTKRAHLPDCPSVNDMKEKNKEFFEGTVQELENRGYKPCGRCNPY
jgi:Adenosine deaminase